MRSTARPWRPIRERDGAWLSLRLRRAALLRCQQRPDSNPGAGVKQALFYRNLYTALFTVAAFVLKVREVRMDLWQLTLAVGVSALGYLSLLAMFRRCPRLTVCCKRGSSWSRSISASSTPPNYYFIWPPQPRPKAALASFLRWLRTQVVEEWRDVRVGT